MPRCRRTLACCRPRGQAVVGSVDRRSEPTHQPQAVGIYIQKRLGFGRLKFINRPELINRLELIKTTEHFRRIGIINNFPTRGSGGTNQVRKRV